jgi:cysteine desulfurase/selenocysteine lyase
VFVRGTTEGINLVANSWGNAQVHAGDNIIITQMEHHANIVPWQMLCERVGAQLRVIPLNEDGTLTAGAARRIAGRPHPAGGGHPGLQRAGD